jgi:hypothetical protein
MINNTKNEYTISSFEEDKLKKCILDFSLDHELRLSYFEKYFQLYNENIPELLIQLCSIYNFSGMKILEIFLFDLCNNNLISSMLKLDSAKTLYYYYEVDEEIYKYDKKNIIEIKTENNKNVKYRNNIRKNKALEALDIVLNSINSEIISSLTYITDGEISITYYIDNLYLLLENGEYAINGNKYFKNIVNNNTIDCDYRYKTILNLENKTNILDRKVYIKQFCLDFLYNTKNMTMYRILSSQYLLQNSHLNDEDKWNIQKIILSFSEDIELDYDLRADAADVLLQLGTEEFKNLGRSIITMLGRIDGNVKTIFDNKQNVHTKDIEKSVLSILEVLLSYQTMKISENNINYEYVKNQIETLLSEEKIKNDNYSEKICNNCSNNNSQSFEFCSKDCEIQFNKYKKIKVSLNRIEIDRTLYLNSTLSTIIVKLWSYINKNDFRDEMIKRLLEELEEMSGTCSSGFITRLTNSISGFGELNICISYEDQLISNFIGRLNYYAKKIIEPTSKFYNDKLYDVIKLFYKNNYNIVTEGRKYLKYTQIDNIIDDFLKKDRDIKIKYIIEDFSENVINEMTLSLDKNYERRHFSLFFSTYFSILREELYIEFKEFINEYEFDIIIRKAISMYEGLQNFI